jgi:hypothetical protein
VPRYLVKANWNKDQLRIAIPKALVQELGWEDTKFVMLKAQGTEYLAIRRFIDGESLKSNRTTNKVNLNK